MILALKILGAVAALLLGILLGLPGRYRQDLEDLERTMERGSGRRRPVKRVFMLPERLLGPLVRRRHEGGRGFEVRRPEDR